MNDSLIQVQPVANPGGGGGEIKWKNRPKIGQKKMTFPKFLDPLLTAHGSLKYKHLRIYCWLARESAYWSIYCSTLFVVLDTVAHSTLSRCQQ